MKRMFLLFLTLAMVSACAWNNRQASSGYGDYYIAQQDYLWRMVIDSRSNNFLLSQYLEPLRPKPSDIKIYPCDLNNDGREDFIATINHFLYLENGTYPLYIMIGQKYGYVAVDNAPRVASFTIAMLPDMHNGFHDFTAAGKIYIFNGNSYVEKQQ